MSVHVKDHVEVRRNLEESLLPAGLGHWTQAIRLSSKHLYILSHLNGSLATFKINILFIQIHLQMICLKNDTKRP